MRTNYLLPHKYKTIGWILFVLGLISGIILFIGDYEIDILQVKVLSIFNEESLFGEKPGFFKIIKNSIVDELIALTIIIGGLLVGFTKEKVEDEFIYRLRTDSLVWALLFNCFVLILTILFVFNFTFLHVMIFNMFTPLVFFIIRFNFLKFKSDSHEE